MSDGAELLVLVLIKGVFAAICAMVANSRGRSAVGWGLLGFFLDCVGLIILLVIPDLKVEEERRRRLQTENRRLREMVRADRQLSDQRHAETQQRISVHDRALGVDTRPPGEIGTEDATPAQIGQAGVLPEELEARRRTFEATEWYFLEGEDKQVGPLSFQSFKMRWRAGEIGATHYVWSPLFDNWQRLGEVEDLEEVMRV